MVKVSVIVPVYNVEKYLRKCMDSIVGQTFRDIEIICIDDGSPDGSINILNEYAEKDTRVKIVRQENVGLGATRNRGIEIACGEYILFVDSDDYLDPKAVELSLKRIEETGAELCLFNARDIDAVTEEPIYHNYLRMGLLKEFETFSAEDLGENIFQITAQNCWNRLYKKELFNDKRLRFYEGIRYEDAYFGFISLLIPKKIAYIDKRLYFYRRNRPGSLMATDAKSSCDIIGAYKLTKEDMLREGWLSTPELKVSYDRKVNGILLFNFSFQAGLPAYRAYYEQLKKDIFTLDLVKEDEEYYSNLSERDRQKMLIATASSEEFLYTEYHRYYRDGLELRYKLAEEKKAVRKRERKIDKLNNELKENKEKYSAEITELKKVNQKYKKALEENKQKCAALKAEKQELQAKKKELQAKYDRLSNKLIIRIGRKIKGIFRKKK